MRDAILTVYLVTGFVIVAAVVAFYGSVRATPASGLAHTIRQTRSSPKRVYFCATHTKNYAALVECLRNV